jgi:cytochrome P450
MGEEIGGEIWRNVSGEGLHLSPIREWLTKCRFTVKFGGSTWVFLNSSRVVTDLMEKRAAIYSSRPPFPMTQDIMSGGGRVVLMPYDDRWRRTRKIMHQILSARQRDTFKKVQDLESKHLLYDYLHNPERWFSANGRYANSIIMSVVFGIRSKLDDPQVAKLFETAEMFLAQQQPGVNIVDGFPILARLPKFLQWWRPRGEKMFRYTRAYVLIFRPECSAEYLLGSIKRNLMPSRRD